MDALAPRPSIDPSRLLETFRTFSEIGWDSERETQSLSKRERYKG